MFIYIIPTVYSISRQRYYNLNEWYLLNIASMMFRIGHNASTLLYKILFIFVKLCSLSAKLSSN